MCLIFVAYKYRAPYDLVIAANRDEFYERPSAPAEFWKENPSVLGGKDLIAGGTWLGITRTGRFAAITNYRDPGSHRHDAPSRGHLVSNFLTGSETPGEYVRNIASRADEYNGFSLFAGDRSSMYYVSNRGGGPRGLSPGLYGLSNHLLDTPWPKVERGKKSLEALFADPETVREDALFGILADRSSPPDELLPRTGVSLEWERILAPPFIVSPVYGTRSSTVILSRGDGKVAFVEKVFNSNPNPQKIRRFEFMLNEP
ncbi:MAG TPA: NRDE family protein [Syntrophales bacterium]|nr:NRDE family protein [Syntrophales bacterium]HOX94168.1 NRDE family protein [Syntrophales bacterium]HPI56307.1 NRDE family protein [Syntrophales bacterium]HPN24494.1 NRDE family protein [Syntrophales bacterium]HQM29124.1 NRDE family protein [Syntrophales bacterium]